MSCNLAIIDLESSRNMTIAAGCIVLGILLAKGFGAPHPILNLVGLSLYVFGWLFVGYNLRQSMPENDQIFWPAIITILSSSILHSIVTESAIKTGLFALYSAAWLALGYIVTNHLDGNNKYLGLLAAVIAIASSLFISTPIGISGYTASFGILTLTYGLPTMKTVEDDLPDCIYSLLSKVPSLSPYATEIKCLLSSPCLARLNNFNGSKTEKLRIIANTFQCAASQCNSPTLSQISNNFDCFASAGCFDDIINNPPTSTTDLTAAMAKVLGCVLSTTNCLQEVNPGQPKANIPI